MDASITTRLKLSAIIAGVIDVVAVVVFVAIGRRNHDEGTTVLNILGVAAPFLIALGVSWLVLRTWRGPFNRASFVATWVITVFIGLVLRRLVFDRGIATSFIIVATITLGVLIGLGRLVTRKLTAKTS